EKILGYISNYFEDLFYTLGAIYEEQKDFRKAFDNYMWIYDEKEMEEIVKGFNMNNAAEDDEEEN
ncbi:MAG TPA: hypothetical protein PLM75_04905, partial [bacterium]|nr:hypothetical protein [bacterium]